MVRRSVAVEWTLRMPHAHERRLDSSHSKPHVATIRTIDADQDVDEVGSSLSMEVGEVGGAFCSAGG